MNARIVAALLLAAATGCIDNNASLRLSAACFPPTPNTDGSCSYPTKCESVMMGNLTVDPAFNATGGTLYWPFQADNQRPNNGDRYGATNTATAFITGFKISYTSTNVSIPDVTLDDTTRAVESESSTVLSIPVVPPSVANLLTTVPGGFAEVRAEIRATGHYGDGTTIETGPFSVVISVDVNGWTPATCVDPLAVVVGYCPQPGQTSIPLCKAP
jgi:hypothetical protein